MSLLMLRQNRDISVHSKTACKVQILITFLACNNLKSDPANVFGQRKTIPRLIRAIRHPTRTFNSPPLPLKCQHRTEKKVSELISHHVSEPATGSPPLLSEFNCQ